MKLFLSDLDKTLLKSNLEVSSFTKEIWNKKSKEKILSIATARSLEGTKELLKGLHLAHPLILLDGAMIATIEGKIIKIKSIRSTYN